jgi:hypothetical protein
MSTRILHPQLDDPQGARELDALALERTLWLAQLTAERAGFRDIAAEILDVLVKAVKLRGEIQAAS